MLLALVIAIVSVALGTACAFVPALTRAAFGPLRLVAMLLVAVVVLFYLLPEAVHAARLWALVSFAIGLGVPSLAHFISDHSERFSGTDKVALEAGYLGFLLHQVGDGIVLGTYGRLPELGAALGVSAALAAHTVPLIGFLALSYRAQAGPQIALLRCAGLALGSALGVILSNVVSTEDIARFDPWVAGLASGFLMHVVFHDLWSARAAAPRERGSP